MTIIKINPREFAKPPISLDFHSAWPWNLIDPFILKELEKRNEILHGVKNYLSDIVNFKN